MLRNLAQLFPNLNELSITDSGLYQIDDKSFDGFVNIQTKAFEGLDKLQKLMLNNNFLTKISNKVFDGLVNVKTLFLQNNKLKFIASNLFVQFPQIAVVNLQENECINETFPETSMELIIRNIIDNCTAPLEMKCEFAEDEIPLQEIQETVGYVCKAQDLNIETSNTKIIRIVGDHINDFDNENVTAFMAIDQSVRFMPFQQGEPFSKSG